MVLQKLNQHNSIKDYCRQFSTGGHDVLSQIDAFNKQNTRKPNDGTDYVQGRFLSFISKMIRPELIVELGTFTGYSTICLAEGLTKSGKIISIENRY